MTGKQIKSIIYLVVIGGYIVGALGLVEFICYVHPEISECSYADVPLQYALLFLSLLAAASITSARNIISYRENRVM